MKTYAGIDLHSSNNYIGVIDAKDRRLYSKRHDNRIEDVLKVLGKFKANLQGVVIESTYNWYWLVDALMDHGYEVFFFLTRPLMGGPVSRFNFTH
jgi:transposase